MQMRVINLFLCSNNTLELKCTTAKSLKSTRSVGRPARRGARPARVGAAGIRPTNLACYDGRRQRGEGAGGAAGSTGTTGVDKRIRHLVIRNRGTRRPHSSAITPGTQSHSTPPTPVLSGNRGNGGGGSLLPSTHRRHLLSFNFTPSYGKGGFSHPSGGTEKATVVVT